MTDIRVLIVFPKQGQIEEAGCIVVSECVARGLDPEIKHSLGLQPFVGVQSLNGKRSELFREVTSRIFDEVDNTTIYRRL